MRAGLLAQPQTGNWFFNGKLELVAGMAEVALGELEDLGGRYREDEDRIREEPRALFGLRLSIRVRTTLLCARGAHLRPSGEFPIEGPKLYVYGPKRQKWVIWGQEYGMQITGEIEVAAPPGDVWNVLLDPEELCEMLPGCEQAHMVDLTHFESTMAVKVQFMTMRGRIHGTIRESDEPNHVVVDLVVDALGKARIAHTLATVDFLAHAGGTRLRYDCDIFLSGRLASLGEPVVRAAAHHIASRFADILGRRFQRGAAAS